MSNKLKTLSKSQLETFIADKVSEYLNEECRCKVSNMDVPNIDTEDHVALHDTRTIRFEVELSYEE